MSLVSWILVGLVAGFIAKLMMPETWEKPSSFLGTMLLGVVGAVAGGWLWNVILNQPGMTGFDVGSLFVAFVGSLVVIWVLRLFDRGHMVS